MTLGMVLTLSEPESVVTIQLIQSVSGSSTCHSVHMGAQLQLLGLEKRLWRKPV